MLCSIPQGTTCHSLGHGPPHFTLGMTQEFMIGLDSCTGRPSADGEIAPNC